MVKNSMAMSIQKKINEKLGNNDNGKPHNGDVCTNSCKQVYELNSLLSLMLRSNEFGRSKVQLLILQNHCRYMYICKVVYNWSVGG